MISNQNFNSHFLQQFFYFPTEHPPSFILPCSARFIAQGPGFPQVILITDPLSLHLGHYTSALPSISQYQLINYRDFLLQIMSESIGALKVPNLIWTATILTLGSLFICWATTKVPHATILQSALQYPYTIIFRVGMMYSLFIYFLELLFIKWWIDSLPFAKHTKKMAIIGTIGLAAYGLFVSCIDRKRINYQIVQASSFIAAVCMTIAIYIIMSNLKKNREQGVELANERSWFWKKAFTYSFFSGISVGALIYTGYIDVQHKVIVEYTTVVSAILFFWTFSIDFKKFKMDVEQINKPSKEVFLE